MLVLTTDIRHSVFAPKAECGSRRAGGAVLFRPGEKIDHHFARTRDFAQTRGRLPVLRVIQHQVEQLEPAVQGGLSGLRILRRPTYRAADLTPNMAELLGE